MSRRDEGLGWPQTHSVGGGAWCWTRTVSSSLFASPQPETTGACRNLPQPRVRSASTHPMEAVASAGFVASLAEMPP